MSDAQDRMKDEALRGTGRTTRMLLRALIAVSEGREVDVVMKTPMAVGFASDVFEKLAEYIGMEQSEPVVCGFAYAGAGRIKFWSKTCDRSGRPSSVVVFSDHDVSDPETASERPWVHDIVVLMLRPRQPWTAHLRGEPGDPEPTRCVVTKLDEEARQFVLVSRVGSDGVLAEKGEWVHWPSVTVASEDAAQGQSAGSDLLSGDRTQADLPRPDGDTAGAGS